MAIHEKKSKALLSYKRNAGIVKILGACIFVCLVFCAGFLVRGNTSLLNSLGFGGLAVVDQASEQKAALNNQDSVSTRIKEVESLLATDSFDSYDLNSATTSVLNALIASTGDSYLHYYDDKSYRSYLESASKADSGIGVLFGENNGSCYVVDVFEGSKAAASGVQEGDCITSIDGTKKDDWTMPEVISALNRNDGESVYITWRRPDTSGSGGELYSTTLPYSSQSVPNVTYQMDGSVVNIDIKQISSDSSALVRQVLQEAISKGATSVVLDARDVPGGYLTQAVEIASLFIPSGTVVQIQTKDTTTVKAADGESVTALPLVVITNGRTAGSAEVLAAALQEAGRATIVGTTTQGKGTVQVMQPLSFGGALRYTAANYLTSNGRAIEGSGVLPDITVSNTDSQLMVALEVAASQTTR